MGKKKEFVIEYDFQSSPQLLFQYLSSPSGLSEWFSDDVNYRGEKYTFFWGESEEYARVLSKKNNEKIRFQWITEEDDEEDYFFEFKIEMDEKDAKESYDMAQKAHLMSKDQMKMMLERETGPTDRFSSSFG